MILIEDGIKHGFYYEGHYLLYHLHCFKSARDEDTGKLFYKVHQLLSCIVLLLSLFCLVIL